MYYSNFIVINYLKKNHLFESKFLLLGCFA